MQEKELRIALVCFGGVSLAVYMHGITKEVLKLIRASAALHSVKDRDARFALTFRETVRGVHAPDEYDTEAVYFDLLREIGRQLDLRVVVDVISGASAGGINGATLARAISHDLPIRALRDLWLDNADVNVLLAEEARAGRWSKLVLQPLVWGAAATGLLPEIKNPEVRRNLSLFIRSRWFQPPLDGPRMSELMLDAMRVMGAPPRPGASLLPSGHGLDLFVTLTDFHGHLHPIPIHDPPVIQEREHRHVLQFRYRRSQSGTQTSDFDLENAPALAFAARATSSFPGIFPPARITEIDALLVHRQIAWSRRDAFLSEAFPRHLRAGIDPAEACFIDGAVLNNRPFREAIAALRDRQAYRQVDRRLVYIDPHPGRAPASGRRSVPSMFSMVKGSLSDLPRNQPVADELDWVLSFNDRARQLRGVIDDARPRVTRLVTEVVAGPLDWAVAVDEVRRWREAVNAQLPGKAGFAYRSYMRLKLTTVLGFVTRLIADLCGVEPRSRPYDTLAASVESWAARQGIMPHADAGAEDDGEVPPRTAGFLLDFDLGYRKRRLHFLIEGQNRLYQLIEEARFPGFDPLVVDHLKRDFYACLDTLNRRANLDALGEEPKRLAREIFCGPPAPGEARGAAAIGAAVAESHEAALTALMRQLASAMGLASSTHDLDLIVAALDPAEWHPEARREVLVNYLGFPYWDVLTLPITATWPAGELHEILVDRISSKDAYATAGFAALTDVKGVGLASFAAFLSRAYRENDYLLGRLHAIDRLIDIVCDAAGLHPDRFASEMLGFKKRAFAALVEAEKDSLRHSGELLTTLREAIATLGSA